MEKKIRIKYNGRRYPRAVSIRGDNNTSFQDTRTTLDLNEYDALFLLKSNSRITPNKWEFTVCGVEAAQEAEKLPNGWSDSDSDLNDSEKKEDGAGDVKAEEENKDPEPEPEKEKEEKGKKAESGKKKRAMAT